MPSFFKEYFNLSAKEQTGVLALCAIILLLFIFPSAYTIFKNVEIADSDEFEKWIASFSSESKETDTHTLEQIHLDIMAEPEYKLFAFNPNTVSKNELIQLGIAEKTADNLLKFREKGGRFYKKEDFGKIYGISESDFKRLENYIHIESATISNKVERDERTLSREPFIVELNSADSAAYTQLKGIGPVIASRIVRYRNMLGGFYHSEQIKEVYGVSDSLYLSLLPYLSVDSLNINQLNINTLDAENLKNHPYINYTTANAIVKYRNQNGEYSSLDELDKLYSLDKSVIEKIKPYLKVSE
jgi:competence protein ComEA